MTDSNKKPAPVSAEQDAPRPIPDSPRLKIISRQDHPVSRQQISPNCLKILYRLNEAGFQAFIVGGGVRDLLLGLKPKDFDIATDATPEEVKKLFHNARIIGRRFRIVHVRYGREIIEVSTFRALHNSSTEVEGNSLSRKVTHLDSAHSQSGLILRDNVYGNINDDVLRRDFTVNALYYTVQGFEIHDYVQGMADIEGRVLRMIGDPLQRYREDPVRILRAIRLSVKLDFTIAPETAAPIQTYASLLESIPPARLFDEFLKLFFHGQARDTFLALVENGVFQVLFPSVAKYLESRDSYGYKLLIHALESTDERIANDKPVTPAFLLAAMLWPAVQEAFTQKVASGEPPMTAMNEVAHDIIIDQIQRLAIPKRFSLPMKEIWEFQLRLPRRTRRRTEQLLGHKRFRAAYDFLLLREMAGEDLEGLGEWWTHYQEADPETRLQMQEALAGNKQNSKSAKRKVKSSRQRRKRHSKQSEKKA